MSVNMILVMLPDGAEIPDGAVDAASEAAALGDTAAQVRH